MNAGIREPLTLKCLWAKYLNKKLRLPFEYEKRCRSTVRRSTKLNKKVVIGSDRMASCHATVRRFVELNAALIAENARERRRCVVASNKDRALRIPAWSDGDAIREFYRDCPVGHVVRHNGFPCGCSLPM